MQDWGVDGNRLSVIPNWAPLENISPKPKGNTWSSKWKFTNLFCFMYTGTLGMKHNPDLLLQLALHFRKEPNVVVVVVSEGPGAEWLKKQKENLSLENLRLFDYQPFDELSSVMGAADVLVAILDPDVGVFSVPSKVLTYLCAQRPILLAVPEENLAAKIINKHEAGFVVSPTDTQAFMEAAESLYVNKECRERFARNGRLYAETHFDIQRITDKFQFLLL
jgi:glycosyltransferase involved in cell wall biosynthesis